MVGTDTKAERGIFIVFTLSHSNIYIIAKELQQIPLKSVKELNLEASASEFNHFTTQGYALAH